MPPVALLLLTPEAVMPDAVTCFPEPTFGSLKLPVPPLILARLISSPYTAPDTVNVAPVKLMLVLPSYALDTAPVIVDASVGAATEYIKPCPVPSMVGLEP